MNDLYPDSTLPEPTQDDRAKGWKIDVKYLQRIAKLVGQDWERPDLETVQCVLLAHAAQQWKLLS